MHRRWSLAGALLLVVVVGSGIVLGARKDDPLYATVHEQRTAFPDVTIPAAWGRCVGSNGTELVLEAEDGTIRRIGFTQGVPRFLQVIRRAQ